MKLFRNPKVLPLRRMSLRGNYLIMEKENSAGRGGSESRPVGIDGSGYGTGQVEGDQGFLR